MKSLESENTKSFDIVTRNLFDQKLFSLSCMNIFDLSYGSTLSLSNAVVSFTILFFQTDTMASSPNVSSNELRNMLREILLESVTKLVKKR